MRMTALVVFALASVILVALVNDLAVIAGRALLPWFGWMLP